MARKLSMSTDESTPAAPVRALPSRPRLLVLVALATAMVFMLPFEWYPTQLFKLAVIGLLFIGTAVYMVRGPGGMVGIASSGGRALWWFAALPSAYIVSALFSSDVSVAWSGYAFESDTVLMMVFAFLSAYFGFALFRTPRSARALLNVLTSSLIAVALFQVVVFLVGPALLPGIFGDRTVNLVGKWNDFGLLMGLLALVCTVRLMRERTRRTIALLAIALVLLFYVNFAVAWYLLVVAGAGIGALFYRSGKSLMLPGALMAFSLVAVIWGSSINTVLTKIIPLTSLEVRPSLATTFDVANTSHNSLWRTLVGSGPNTFQQSWVQYRPQEINESPFWNLDFTVGFSSVLTSYATTGLFGVLAWLLALFALLRNGLQLWREERDLSGEESETVLLSLFGALYLLLALFLYVPSQAVVLVTFLLGGVALAAFATKTPSAPSRLPQMFVYVPAAALLLAVIVVGGMSLRRAVSESFVNAGLIALSQQRATDALASAATARAVDPTSNALRLALEAGTMRLEQIAAQENSDAAQQAFVSLLQPTIDAGRAAIAAAPNDYRPYFSLGRLYTFLSGLGVQGAYPTAQETLTAAESRNATTPAISLLRARLEVIQNNGPEAQKHLTAALTKKSNYTEAILFLVQLNVAAGDLSAATEGARAAVASAPGNAGLWFQLGLLLYAGENTKDAITALEQAIALVPTYANAKYFLGLSYYAEGRSQEAIQIFEGLAAENPDNAEVKQVLTNMKLGAPAFPEEASTPVEEGTPPIEETETPTDGLTQ